MNSQQDTTEPRTGAHAIVHVFKEHGIERLYVYPGGTIAPILDCAKQEDMEIFCARHEQGAGYAALALARLTQTPQVVMVTSGPGVTNIITTVADAYYDSTPLVVLTGQVGTGDLRRDLPLRQRGFQECDTIALLRPVTKAQYQPEETDELVDVMREAFRKVVDGRPGPVLVDLPMDVQRGIFSQPFSSPSGLEKVTPAGPQADDVKQLVDWLMNAKRPLVIAGQGVLQSQAQEALRAFVERGGIPVSHSLLGLGAINGDSPLSLGFHGHTGNQYAGKAIHDADLVIAVGSRLDVRQTGNQFDSFAPGARLVRVDIDADEVRCSRIRTDLRIGADAGITLEALNQSLEATKLPDWLEWRERIDEWRKAYPLSYDKGHSLKPQQIVETASRLSSERKVICVSGVGAHQHWVARHFCFDYPQRRWLTSGGHGAMGYDLPTAIGAQLAAPDALVLCIVGDGSLQINIQELAVLAEHRLPVKVIVLDNHRLGIVSQFQHFNWHDDPATGDKWNPDFAAIARGYGIKAFTLDATDRVDGVLSQALAEEGPVLVHCLIDKKADIVPMLLAGQRLDKMWPYDE